MVAILIHVAIALISIVQTTFLLFTPSKTKLYGTYALFGATLASGTYLSITRPTHIVTTCIEGIAYIGFVVWSIIVISRKLAKKTTTE